ncbi:hypothetical protein PCI56_21240 [Plesiomonas shigelloides subsp. oncorhynchi]|nr:hypothetical protein [Plesiomonas shigelloides]
MACWRDGVCRCVVFLLARFALTVRQLMVARRALMMRGVAA